VKNPPRPVKQPRLESDSDSLFSEDSGLSLTDTFYGNNQRVEE
jgi:hypothetical protein